jgi:hypothetical protein
MHESLNPRPIPGQNQSSRLADKTRTAPYDSLRHDGRDDYGPGYWDVRGRTGRIRDAESSDPVTQDCSR